MASSSAGGSLATPARARNLGRGRSGEAVERQQHHEFAVARQAVRAVPRRGLAAAAAPL